MTIHVPLSQRITVKSYLKLVHTLVLRSLFHNKLRSIFTILGISLGVAVYLAIQLLNHSAIESFENNLSFLDTGYNLEIHSKSSRYFDEEVLHKIYSVVKENEKIIPLIKQTGLYSPRNSPPEVIDIIGVDFIGNSNDTDPNVGWEIISDNNKAEKTPNFLALFEAESFMISGTFAQIHHIRVGDILNVQLANGVKSLRIAGIYRVKRNHQATRSNQTDSTFYSDISVVQDFLDRSGRLSSIQISTQTDSREILDRLQARILEQLPRGLEIESNQAKQSQIQKMLASFQINLQALSMVSLLVGMFLIYNTLSISIVRRRREIGILRTLGMRQNELFGVFLTEASIIGFLGVLLGLILGIAIATIGMQNVSHTLQTIYGSAPLKSLDFDASLLLITFFIGMTVNLLAALPPIIEATRVPPALSSRPRQETVNSYLMPFEFLKLSILFAVLGFIFSWLPPVNINERTPVFGYIASFLFMLSFACITPITIYVFSALIQKVFVSKHFILFRLATTFLQRSIGKASVSIASLTVSLALVISISVMIDSFRNTVIDWVKQTLKADIFIEVSSRSYSRSIDGVPEEVIQLIQSIQGVGVVDNFIERNINLVRNNEKYTIRLGAGHPEILDKLGNLNFLNGKNPHSVLKKMASNKHNVIISESLATRFNLHEGEILTIPSPKGDLKLSIVGIYYDYASELGYVILSRKLYDPVFDDTSSTNIAIYLNHTIKSEVVKANIYKTLHDHHYDIPLTLRSNKELRTEVLRIFDETFAITNMLLIVSILIAGLSVAITLYTLVLQFEADFTLLRYLGSSLSEVRKIIIYQGSIFGTIGALLGSMNGYILSLLLILVINKQSFGWTIYFSWSWSFIISLIIAVILGATLSAILPALKHQKLLKPESLHHE